VRNLASMMRGTAMTFIGILVTGLVVPAMIWEDYLYIYVFHGTVKGNVYDTAAAIVIVVPFSLVMWYVQVRRHFDLEDRIGWALVPLALFTAIKMRVARHLLIVLLVPDKRGDRNAVAAVALALRAVWPDLFHLASVMYMSVVLLCLVLVRDLRRIGWPTVKADLRRPARTLRLLLLDPQPSASGVLAGGPS
jgi:hypothetical protein